MQVATLLTVVLGLLASIVDASVLTPPVLPLIVRNPYLSTWLPNARDVPWKKWPTFWTGEEVRPFSLKTRHDIFCLQVLIFAPNRSASVCLPQCPTRIQYILYWGALMIP